MGADQTWSFANGSGAFTFNGGVNTVDSSGTAHVLTIYAPPAAGSGVTLNAAISGGGGLNKRGGTIMLTAPAPTRVPQRSSQVR